MESRKIIYDDEFGLNNQKKGARGGGKNQHTTKKDAKANKHKSCYNFKYIRKIESRIIKTEK